MVDDGTAIDQDFAIVEYQCRDTPQRIGGSYLGSIVEAGKWQLLVWHSINLERDGHAAREWRAIYSNEHHFNDRPSSVPSRPAG
jgi:hypothetical protein